MKVLRGIFHLHAGFVLARYAVRLRLGPVKKHHGQQLARRPVADDDFFVLVAAAGHVERQRTVAVGFGFQAQGTVFPELGFHLSEIEEPGRAFLSAGIGHVDFLEPLVDAQQVGFVFQCDRRPQHELEPLAGHLVTARNDIRQFGGLVPLVCLDFQLQAVIVGRGVERLYPGQFRKRILGMQTAARHGQEDAEEKAR